MCVDDQVREYQECKGKVQIAYKVLQLRKHSYTVSPPTHTPPAHLHKMHANDHQDHKTQLDEAWGMGFAMRGADQQTVWLRGVVTLVVQFVLSISADAGMVLLRLHALAAQLGAHHTVAACKTCALRGQTSSCS